MPANLTCGECYSEEVALLSQVKWEDTALEPKLLMKKAAKPGIQPTVSQLLCRDQDENDSF